MIVNRKTAAIAILSIAIIAAAISFVQSTMTAQPPVKTLPASPQGEWVALRAGGGANDPVQEVGFEQSAIDRTKKFRYVALYNTGTGKIRLVRWPAYQEWLLPAQLSVTETP